MCPTDTPPLANDTPTTSGQTLTRLCLRLGLERSRWPGRRRRGWWPNVEAMARDAVTFIDALGLEEADLLAPIGPAPPDRTTSHSAANPDPNQNNPEPIRGSGSFRCLETSHGGAKGIRTPDLLHAMQTRYQLRHSPAAHHRVLREEHPARWNVVSIPVPRPCVVHDPNVTQNPSPARRSSLAKAPTPSKLP